MSRDNLLSQKVNLDPVSIYDQNKYLQDKMLIEQDPFLLEE
jgi:hypothetical protein